MVSQNESSQADAQIFLDFEPNALPPLDDFLVLGQTIYKRKIASWRDPFTIPGTRFSCLRKVRIPGDGEVCVEFKTEYQWLYVELFVVVVVAKPYELQKIVEDCLKTAAIAAAIAAILGAVATGGVALAATLEAFIVALKACLILKIEQGDLVDVRLERPTHWGEWE